MSPPAVVWPGSLEHQAWPGPFWPPWPGRPMMPLAEALLALLPSPLLHLPPPSLCGANGAVDQSHPIPFSSTPRGSRTIPRGISSPLSSFPFSLFCLPPTFDLSPHTAISAGSTSLWSIDYWTASSTIYPSLCVRGLRSCSYVPSTNGLRCWKAPVGRLWERKFEDQPTISLGSTEWPARPTIDPSLHVSEGCDFPYVHTILTQIFSFLF